MALEVPVLRELQGKYGTAIDDALETWLSAVGHDDLFSGMMRYQLGSVDENLQPTNVGGGKRFRPLLCLLACDLTGGAWRNALPIAVGIELLHNFSLIHDDIEDRDPSRRHRATVWKVWGEAQAINAGDGMFALATRAVASVPDAALGLQLVRGFQDMSLDLTRGQYLDMSFESRQEVTAAEYLEMISLKTAAIIRFSAWAGGMIAGAEEDRLNALARFGDALGRAFQIADDIQGIWGLTERTGKEPASDIRNRKKSLPVLLALEGAAGSARDALHRYYSGASDNIEPVLRVLKEMGVRQQSDAVAHRYREEAIGALKAARLSSHSSDPMEQLVFELTQD